MKPLHINFKPSILFSVIIILLSLAAAVILILLALSWQIKLLLVIAILFSAIYTVSERGLLLLPWSLNKLDINTKNELQLTRRDGVQFTVATVRADSVVTPYLTIVHYHAEDAALLKRLFSSYLVILPDAIEAESYRQLRVWLRWGYARKGTSKN